MRRRPGMTLLELAIALAVGGATLAAGGAAVATMLDRRQAVLEDAEVDGRALTARRLLVAWVSDVRVGTAAEGAFDGRRGSRRTPSGDVADDSVSFFTMAGGGRSVHLFVDRTADRPTLVADVTSAGQARERIALAPDVAGFEVSYLTSAFGRREWRRRWTGALLPTAVVFRLRATDGSVLPAPLRLPVTVPLANSQ